MRPLVLDKKGFTLLELIVVITIIGMVVTTIFSILFFGYDVYGLTSDDYALQSQVKVSLEQINTLVRDSRALFAVPDTGYFDDEWDYIALSEDKTRIESHQWNPSINDHVVKVMVGPFDGITFNIGFDKENSMSKDNTLRMYYEALTNDGTTTRFDIKSGYQALNSMQVVDYGTVSNPATVLAYRSDNFVYENFNLIVNIAMVLDVSGSMGWELGDTGDSRISVLREKAEDLVKQFAENQNDDVSINMSLIPFSYDANDLTDFYDIKMVSEKNSIIEDIRDLRANGNTNTGDALRRAYYQISDKQEEDVNYSAADTIVKNYTIILVDGDSNLITLSDQYYNGRWQPADYYLGDKYVSGYYDWFYDDLGIITSTWTASRNQSTINTYVTLTGNLINDSEMFTNYVIAFSNSVSSTEIQLIADSTGTPEERVFYAADADELGLSFSDIQLSITNDLWHFLGPNLINPEE